jgi:hypothetical protein
MMRKAVLDLVYPTLPNILQEMDKVKRSEAMKKKYTIETNKYYYEVRQEEACYIKKYSNYREDFRNRGDNRAQQPLGMCYICVFHDE